MKPFDPVLIIGFDWDQGNLLKNWVKHKVSNEEIEETFFNKPILYLHDDKHTNENETRHYLLGHTFKGRCLTVSFTVRKNKIRPVSAKAMSKKERKFYEENS